MKPFYLDEYTKNPSKKIITRDGRAVKIICIDAKGNFPVIGLVADDVNDASSETPISFTTNGKYWNNQNERADSPLDLFFASEKHEGWINIYKGEESYYPGAGLYSTKEEAIEESKKFEDSYIATIKIEWEDSYETI